MNPHYELRAVARPRPPAGITRWLVYFFHAFAPNQHKRYQTHGPEWL